MARPRGKLITAQVFCRVERAGGIDKSDAKIAPNGKAYDLKIRASTSRIARDAGIIEVTAWEDDLDTYRDNPMIMFAHDYRQPPVANAVHTDIDHADGSLVQYIKWLDGLTNDAYDDLAHRLHRLYEVGGMRTWSVGFRIKEWREPTDEEREEATSKGERVEWVATKAALLETSAVPVPADPGADTIDKELDEARQKGMDVGPILRAWNDRKRQSTSEVNCKGCGDGPLAASEIFIADDRLLCQRCHIKWILARQDGTTVQTLIFPKAKWSGLDAAKKWAGDNDFKVAKVDTTDDSWRFRQHEPSDFQEGALDNGETFSTICLLPNDVKAKNERCRVKAVIGKLKKAIDAADSHLDDQKKSEPVSGPSHIQKVEDERGAISFGVHAKGTYGAAPRDSEWSASKEVGAMPSEANALRPRHTWVDSEADTDLKSSYKFPHHRASSNRPVVFRALANGFARLNQAKIPDSDKDGIAAHLGRHMRIDFDAEPPEREALNTAIAAFIELGADARADALLDWITNHAEVLQALGGSDLGLALDSIREVVGETLKKPEPKVEPGDTGGHDTQDGATRDWVDEHLRELGLIGEEEDDSVIEVEVEVADDEDPEEVVASMLFDQLRERLEGRWEKVAGQFTGVPGLRD